MPVPIPDRIQRMIDSVEASMTDDQIERMAGGDGRLLTSLKGQRARRGCSQSLLAWNLRESS